MGSSPVALGNRSCFTPKGVEIASEIATEILHQTTSEVAVLHQKEAEDGFNPEAAVLDDRQAISCLGSLKNIVVSHRILCIHAGMRHEGKFGSETNFKLDNGDSMQYEIKYCDVSQDDFFEGDLIHSPAAILFTQVLAGRFRVVVGQLPSKGIARALYANGNGPKPQRSFDFPFGFPWASKQHMLETDRVSREAGYLFTLAFACMKVEQSEFILVAPEDRGATVRGDPAPWWQFTESEALTNMGCRRIATYMCKVNHQAARPSPTAFLTSLPFKLPGQVEGPPKFEISRLGRKYVGLCHLIVGVADCIQI